MGKASRPDKRFHPAMLYRSLADMIRIANMNGFACGYEGNGGIYFHNTAFIREFSLGEYKGVAIKSPFPNFGHWLDNMGIKLPQPTTPVCYGGNFVAKASRVYANKLTLQRMERSLTRGNSIEEGHFAERTWAVLFSYTFNSKQND